MEWYIGKTSNNPYFKLMDGKEALFKVPFSGFLHTGLKCQSCEHRGVTLETLFEHVLETGHVLTPDLNE